MNDQEGEEPELFHKICTQINDFLLENGFEVEGEPGCAFVEEEPTEEQEEYEYGEMEDGDGSSDIEIKIARLKQTYIASWRKLNKWRAEMVSLRYEGGVGVSIDVVFRACINISTDQNMNWVPVDIISVSSFIRKKFNYKLPFPLCFKFPSWLKWRAERFATRIIDDVKKALPWFDNYNSTEKFRKKLISKQLANKSSWYYSERAEKFYKTLMDTLDEIDKQVTENQ